MTDPIADMFTRIRNALIARHKSVDVPASRIKIEITRILKEEGFIGDYKVVEDGVRKMIKIDLLYTPDGEAVIKEIQRVSKPGCRAYVSKRDLPRVRGGLGISIVSTSRGIMTGTEARRLKIGGELICTVL
ncbi:MAG TPA: 30S ribosomal protein S8 [Thermodesulfobacteriota bacterium]|jgi:small subunit ribosomal protein S8|nr:30S ribosomal protein S8 [Thermodesulfobacteriota bacterium]